MVRNRLALFGVEIEEQKARLVRLLVLTGAAVCLANLAVLLVAATIVVLVGDDARGPVLIGLSVLVVAATTVVSLVLRKELRGAPPPFKDSLAELEKDREWLKSRS